MRKRILALSGYILIGVCLIVAPSVAQVSTETPADNLIPKSESAEPVEQGATAGTETPPVVPSSATRAPAADGVEQLASLPQLPSPVTSSPVEMELLGQIAVAKPATDLGAMPSLFFTVWEHDLILDARRGLNTRPSGLPDGTEGEEAEAPSGPRDIALSGIVYRSSKDWTVWLNSMRISPDRIPTQLMDIKVFKDYIEIEWFDEQTNQIFPIRLRTYQRFNIDSRIFLPG